MLPNQGTALRFLRSSACALVAAALAAGTATAAGPSRFKAPPKGPLVASNPKALFDAGNAPTTFVLELAAAPVTRAMPHTPLNVAQRQNLGDSIRAAQLPIEDQVRAAGGTVLSAFQYAYNGIKVRVPASSIDRLAALPGVIAVHRLQTFKPNNVHGVPLSGGPAVWGGHGTFHGEGILIADIDSGIDYTHADFGGPGTVEAYTLALAHDAESPDPNLVGPDAPKVKGGIDLAGDDYNADPSDPAYQPVPHPDDNPLDCGGHGTHTAGTMTGFGVLDDGSTYTGGYNENTVANHTWRVGPGMAPRADLYAVRVFGCAGSSDLVIDAIEWAVRKGMDVINMSLGSPFGSSDDPTAAAATNAANAGVIVVASAGNAGPTPYLVGSPSTGLGVTSVAASDPTPGFPAELLTFDNGKKSTVIDANGIGAAGQSLKIKVLYTGTPHDVDHISLGCDPADYDVAGVAGALVVVKRGTCARVARAIFGEQAGAAAVLLVNTTDDFPPFEGDITENPDTGEPFLVHIPFFGLPLGQGAKLIAATPGNGAFSVAADVPNPAFLLPASFTSGGSRTGDSGFKPEVIGPGWAIISAGMGSGDRGLTLYGTSMAAPHATGEAALVKQAHRIWGESHYWRAAIVNTADPGLVNPYSSRIAGVGHIQADAAVKTNVVVEGPANQPEIDFGNAELFADFSDAHEVTVTNLSTESATFDISVSHASGVPHTATPSKQRISLPAHGTESVSLHLDVPADSAGSSAQLNQATGLLEFTPVQASNHGVTLRVPYSLTMTALANIQTRINVDNLVANGTAQATTTNAHGQIPGFADWYAWGLSDPVNRGAREADIRAVGAQAFDGGIAFAIKTNLPWSNPAMDEFHVFIDVDNDGKDDYRVSSIDLGLITTGSYNGTAATLVVDLATKEGFIDFLTDAPFNSDTLVMPARLDRLCNGTSPCLAPGHPRFTYYVKGISWAGGHNTTAKARFNAFTPAITTGLFYGVAPGTKKSRTVVLDADEWKKTPAKGLMIISHDNPLASEAQLIRVVVP